MPDRFEPTPPTSIVLGETRVELAQRWVISPARETLLSANEARILGYLAARAGIAVSRDELQTAVLGHSPISLSRAVDAAVARLRAKIEPRPADPRYLLTIYGVGYRLDVGEPRTEPLPVPPRAPPAAAPPVLSALVGRSADLIALRDALAGAPMVYLFGPPGVGKARLAREVAITWPGPVRWVDLREVPAAQIVERIAGRRDAPTSPRGVTDNGEGALIVIDGVDAFDEAQSSALSALAVSRRSSRWLVTCRRAPPGAGHARMRLGPLAGEDAASLFLARAASAGATLRGSERAAAQSLSAALAGNALAIEHLAARTVVLPPSELLRRLREHPESLAGPEEQWLAGISQWAWSLLSVDERQAVAELLHFRSPFDVPSAECVLSTSGGRVPLDLLRALVDRGLLVAHDAMRFEVYPLFRLAGLGRLPAPHAEGHAAARQRWADVTAALARQATQGPPTLAVLDELLAREADLRHRFELAVEEAEQDLVADLALALWATLERLGPASQLLRLLDRAIAAAPEARRLPELRLHRAILCFNTSERDGGSAELSSLATEPPEAPWGLYARIVVCTVQMLRDESVAPDDVLAEVERLPGLVDPLWSVRTAFARGQLLAVADRHGEAIAWFRKAADLGAADGDVVAEGRAWRQLALAYVAAGEARAALAALARTEALERLAGPWSKGPNAEHHRGTVLHEVGELEAAEGTLRAGWDRALRSGLPAVAYEGSLGWLLVERGHAADAIALLSAVLDRYRASGHAYNVVVTAASLACALHLSGDTAEALRVVTAAGPVAPTAPFAVRWVLGLTALLHVEAGDRPAGAEAFAAFAPARTAQLTMAGPVVDLVAARLEGARPALRGQVPSSIARVVYRLFGAGIAARRTPG